MIKWQKDLLFIISFLSSSIQSKLFLPKRLQVVLGIEKILVLCELERINVNDIDVPACGTVAIFGTCFSWSAPGDTHVYCIVGMLNRREFARSGQSRQMLMKVAP